MLLCVCVWMDVIGLDDMLNKIRLYEGKSRDPSEPLTLSALMDKSATMTAPGKGEFRYGQAPYWNIS